MKVDYSTMTEREWLAEQGLAKPGTRGRFSKAAHEALTKVKAGGAVFKVVEVPTKKSVDSSAKSKTANPVVKQAVSKRAKGDSPKVVVRGSASKVTNEKRPDVNAKAVREWAVSKGMQVAERGRLNSEIVSAYLAAVKPEDRAEPATKNIGESAPRVYAEGQKFEAEINGKTVVTTAGDGKAACMRSGYSIAYCGNHTGAHKILVAESREPVEVVARR